MWASCCNWLCLDSAEVEQSGEAERRNQSYTNSAFTSQPSSPLPEHTCKACGGNFDTLAKKHVCVDCKKNYCSRCSAQQEPRPRLCHTCQRFYGNLMERAELMKLKVKELRDYLHLHEVSTHLCREKEELVELVLGQQSSPSSGSAPETLTPDPPSIIPDPPISTLTPEPSTPSLVLTPDPPAAQPEVPDPPTETVLAEPEVEDEDQGLCLFVLVQTWDPEEPQVPGRRASLSDLSCLDDIEALTVRQLKEILSRNFVDYKGCCEKWELMERVTRLYQDRQNLLAANAVNAQETGGGNAGLEENICKICMDSPIDCVLLECGHMITCTKCGKRMSECPVCRGVMAEGADCCSVNAAKRKQPAGRKSRQSQQKKTSCSRVNLEKVLGITTASSSGLTCDSKSGLIAYPAGCVIVLLHPKKNKQSHIINSSRKPFSALAFSHDGKHLVTGESGHMPCVRVWEVGGGQVAEVQSHKYGVSCVAFSTNSCYIVSVGYQHDMTVSVWDWKKGSIIASNKVSSRVFAVSFSQDSSYFVTAGNRHVKFWYLDASKERRVNSTVPLIGRSGLLGDHKNSVFSGVACGRGRMASSTYCITSSGLLCLFNSSRQLEAWVNLKTSSASCVVVSEDLIFCGCADGLIRVFSPSNLQYITTLHRPHRLGVDLTQSVQHGVLPASPGAQYPDTLALTFDIAAKHLTCVYNDHSLYVWDVKDVKNAGKLYSALYHSSCVWSTEVSDLKYNRHYKYYRKGEAAGADGKAGIRVLGISPDGQQLAAGDRCGNLRIFGLEFLDELVKIEAHDSEVLCLEFSPTSTGVKLLASASRDRLIHIFNLDKNYSLEQTLNDHSASITAVKFTGESPEVRMVSCGADKSIYFQTAEQTEQGLSFSRSHHVVEKTTLYDMDLDSSRSHVAIACQDRNVRVYNVETGKLKKCLKGSSSDEGALLKVQMDVSGSFFATSCSDKNITIFDYEDCHLYEVQPGLQTPHQCLRRQLDSQMTATMRKRRGLGLKGAPETCVRKQPNIRRETFITVPSSQLHQMEEEEGEDVDSRTPGRLDLAYDAQLLQTNGKLPMWFRKLGHGGAPAVVQSDAEPRQVRSRWTEQLNPLTICSSFSPSPTKEEEEGQREEEEEEEEDFHPQSLESILGEEEGEEEEEDGEGEEEKEVLQTSDEDKSSYILYPNTTTDREFNVEAVTDPQQSLSQLEVRDQGVVPVWSTQLSPDSACSEGSAGSLEQQHDADTDSLSQGSSVGSLGLEDDDDRNSLKNHFDTLASSLNEERFDTDLRNLQPPSEKHFLNPRLSISTRFLSRFQDKVRAWPSRGQPPVSIQTRISEENDSSTMVKTESSVNMRSAESTQKENSSSSAHNSSVTSAVQQGPSRYGYLGTTASSRAKVSQDTPSSAFMQEEGKENLSSSSEPQPLAPMLAAGVDLHTPTAKPHQDQTNSVTLSHQSSQHCVPAGGHQVLATPTEATSGRRTGSSDEETPTNQNQTLPASPALSVTPTAAPTASDIITSTTGSDITTCSTLRRRTLQGRPRLKSSLMQNAPPPSAEAGADEELPSLQQCQEVANELRQTARRAVHLYQQLGMRPQLSCVLQEAFDFVHTELQTVRQGDGWGGSAPSGQLEDDRTMSLLEKYSELLVQMTQKKLNQI
ncbi:hypothetical protein INR49_018530 [Caranx melampygus]|nr:hypothetical protein INR49_018530 [Caranx melampygus]